MSEYIIYMTLSKQEIEILLFIDTHTNPYNGEMLSWTDFYKHYKYVNLKNLFAQKLVTKYKKFSSHTGEGVRITVKGHDVAGYMKNHPKYKGGK